jgi:hypothetical protein
MPAAWCRPSRLASRKPDLQQEQIYAVAQAGRRRPGYGAVVPKEHHREAGRGRADEVKASTVQADLVQHSGHREAHLRSPQQETQIALCTRAARHPHVAAKMRREAKAGQHPRHEFAACLL